MHYFPLPPYAGRVTWFAPNCARPTRAFVGRALREHRESPGLPSFLSFPLLLLCGIVLEGVGRWFSTARIEGPQFYRGASASKEDRLATPRSLIRSGSGRYQRVFDAPDLDLSSVFFSLRQVVGGLHSKPCLGAATECFF